MTITALRRIGRNVSGLGAAAAFYEKALGFQPSGPVMEDPALAELLGVDTLRVLRLRLGAQEIELSERLPKSPAYPVGLLANDTRFQHIAIVTTNIAQAARQALRAGAVAMSRNGPVHLPVSSGDVTAFKFRDPDGHPLEFLQFPKGSQNLRSGFDHSAISVSDMARSVAFYADMGLTLAARQVNQGPEQDALDGLATVTVDVVAMRPPVPAPHVELLGYRAPRACPAAPYAPS